MIVATRVLGLSLDGKIYTLEVRIHAPMPNGDSWDCEYEIPWPDHPRRRCIGGVDAVQALLLVMEIIGVELYTSEHHKAGRLFWWEPGSGYGFPVASTVRDLLEGDDKRFFE